MKDSVALSIVVPCYKVEKYLPKCLDSLVNQSLENIEIICINDGSPDKCKNIISNYANRYPGKVVLLDKQNEGVWKGRWDGIRIARGEYIGFVDSDDYVEPDFAKSLYTAAHNENADIAVCGFRRIELETGKVLSYEMCDARSSFCIDSHPGRLIELNGAPWNKCFRADILKKMRNLDNPPTVLDDLAFHLLTYLDVTHKVVFISGCYVNYMVRSDSIINTVRQDQVASIKETFLTIRSFYQDARPSLMETLDAIAFLHLGISLIFRLFNSPAININSELREITSYLDRWFPSWRRSPYMSFSYALKNKGAFLKLAVVQRIFRLHAMPAFLALYSFIITKMHVDIKW